MQIPANPFEWQRYCVEESARRGDQNKLDANETSRKRSMASSKAVERQLKDVPALTKYIVHNQ